MFQLSKHNQFEVYLLSDPLEKEAPSSGNYLMSDGKSNAWINTSNTNTRRLYAAAYEKLHYEFRPRGDRRHYLRLLSKITTEHNRIADEMKEDQWSFDSKYRFNEALIRVRHVVQPGSLVYIFSDFSSFNEECRKQMFQLSKHNQLEVYLLSDPLEKEAPSFGTYVMSDGKSNAWINSSNTNIRRLYSETFDKDQQNLSEELRSCRVTLNLLSTVDSLYQNGK